MAATTYTASIDARGLDTSKFIVGVHVIRKDGRALTAADLAACEAAFPAAKKAPQAKKPAAKRTAATPKRKAAKRS